MILTTNFVELITSGTSGWSSALVEELTATSIADDKASTDEMRTYVREVSLTTAGTKAAASFSELATNITVRMAPKAI